MNQNRELAGATLAHLAGLGVKNIIVCAGARNAPLVASLLGVEEEAGWHLWHHFDERTASFFALGLAKHSRKPVAVVTTSGSAVAEILPATIEAYYSGIPLILVTADRPVSYRGSGAPQAIEQVGIFGLYAPVAIDVQAPTDLSWVLNWSRKEPLHLNISFEEPSATDPVDSFEPVELPLPAAAENHHEGISVEGFVANPGGLVVLLGELEQDWRGPVEQFLAALKVPVWAEATSGLRESEALSDQLIRQERKVESLKPRKILRIGGVPSLRFWRDLESLESIEVMSVARRPFSGLSRLSRLLVCDHFASGSAGLSPLRSIEYPLQEEGLKASLQRQLMDHPGSEPAMMRALSELIPSEALVFLGNSLPIREWNLAASFEQAHPRCVASRGANGIDGQLATFLGLSEAEEESWGVFGDLTALYDLNAPALLDQLPKACRRLVVMNNGGGKIFSRLPSLSGLKAEEKQVTENHHQRSFESWASMWGMDYLRWAGGDRGPAIEGDAVVVEIVPSEEETENFWKSWK